jgi:hypothetical protein
MAICRGAVLERPMRQVLNYGGAKPTNRFMAVRCPVAVVGPPDGPSSPASQLIGTPHKRTIPAGEVRYG